MQVSIQGSRSRHGDSVQKANAILLCIFAPDWFTRECEGAIGFNKRAPANRDFRIAE